MIRKVFCGIVYYKYIIEPQTGPAAMFVAHILQPIALQQVGQRQT